MRLLFLNLQKLIIDSNKEFNVSVEAALFFCKLNTPPEFTCTEFDFYNQFKALSQFGWVNEKFVSNIEFAAYTFILLNSDKTKAFLQSITFSDAKRTFTKDILMRIDLYSLALQISEIYIKQGLDRLNVNYNLGINLYKRGNLLIY